MQPLKVLYKFGSNPAKRVPNCTEIIDGTLAVKCKLPGLEVEIFLFLIQVLNLDVYWIPEYDNQEMLERLERNDADMSANLKGNDNMIKHNISAIVVPQMYEARAFSLKYPFQ